MPKSFALCRQSVFITMMINHPWLGTLIAITTVTVKYISWPLRYWGCHEGGEHKLKKGVRLKTSPWRYEIVFNGSAVINFSFLISHCLNDSTARIQVLTWVKCTVSYFKDSPLQIHGNLETFKTTSNKDILCFLGIFLLQCYIDVHVKCLHKESQSPESTPFLPT